MCFVLCLCFQAEDGIRDLVRSRGLGDVYKRQGRFRVAIIARHQRRAAAPHFADGLIGQRVAQFVACLLYTSDAADERSSVDLGGRRIIKKNNRSHIDAPYVDINTRLTDHNMQLTDIQA